MKATKTELEIALELACKDVLAVYKDEDGSCPMGLNQRYRMYATDCPEDCNYTWECWQRFYVWKAKKNKEQVMNSNKHDDTFCCVGCNRIVPVDFGCADDMPELCDDCWLHVTKLRREYAEENKE